MDGDTGRKGKQYTRTVCRTKNCVKVPVAGQSSKERKKASKLKKRTKESDKERQIKRKKRTEDIQKEKDKKK